MEDPTVRAFIDKHGTTCSSRTFTFWHHLRSQVVLVGLFVLFCYDYKIFLSGAVFVISALYALTIAYRLFTVSLSLVFRPEIQIEDDRIAALTDDELPVYTILLPLYKEAAIAEKIVGATGSLDYPKDKLDVKLLLEEDDEETLAACEKIELPSYVDKIIVPQGFPKTKPRACNHGLLRAKGEFLVIYDAEDRPDPDQLKKAVLAFRDLPQRAACVQAKLNHYNPHENTFTKWFALEYTAWFDLFLPGLHMMGVPIPLGGTSNHFRTSVIQDLGGWDPFNLTEDCDLGIRLYRKGWRTYVLDSTTWEEANAVMGNWIRQRSRWVKGYIQTHLAHSRSYLRTFWDLGPKGMFSFILTVGGFSAMLLLNPIFWILGLAYVVLAAGHAGGFTPEPWQMIYNDPVSDLPGAPLTLWSRFSHLFWFLAVALFIANGLFVAINLLACVRRKLWRLIPYALTSPLYWVLISVAAWKGFLQLFTRPFYWEKTVHGIAPGDEGGELAVAESSGDETTAPQADSGTPSDLAKENRETVNTTAETVEMKGFTPPGVDAAPDDQEIAIDNPDGKESPS